MGFISLLGRVLIITALVSSAYHHLQHPGKAVDEFKSNYNIVDKLTNQYVGFDIPYDNVRKLIFRPTGSWAFVSLVFSRL